MKRNQNNNVLQKILLFIMVMIQLVLATPTNHAFAQTSTVTQLPGNPFQISVEIGTQSVFDLTVPLTIKFTPSSNFSKIGITWDYSDGITITNQFSNYFAVTKGKEYTLTAKLVPTLKGDYNLTATVTAWEASTNYTSSKAFNLVIDKNLNVYPSQAGYQTQIIAIIVGGVVALIVVILLLRKPYKLLSAAFKNWVKPPKI